MAEQTPSASATRRTLINRSPASPVKPPSPLSRPFIEAVANPLVADLITQPVVDDATDTVATHSPIRTKRWNDPAEREDGYRVLVCRYRPRGVRKDAETWDTWLPQLGPSRELHADYYGKHGPPIAWAKFRRCYLAEIAEQAATVMSLAARVAHGGTVTLLCSAACVDPERCHQALLKDLVEKRLARAE